MCTSEESWPHPYKVSHLKEIKTNPASIFHVQEQCPSLAHPILFLLLRAFCQKLSERKSMSIMTDDCSPPEHLLLLLRSQMTHKGKNLAFTAFLFETQVN